MLSFKELSEHMYHKVEVVGYAAPDDDSKLEIIALECKSKDCDTNTIYEVDRGDLVWGGSVHDK